MWTRSKNAETMSGAGGKHAIRPLSAGYDFEWPFPRKLAYFVSLALTTFWGLAFAGYSLVMIFTGGFTSDALKEKFQGAWVSVVAWTPVWVGLSTPLMLAAGLIWALWLRHRGWYGRSVAVQFLPLVPLLILKLLEISFQLRV